MFSGKFNTKNKFVFQENQNKNHFSKHYQSGNEILLLAMKLIHFN